MKTADYIRQLQMQQRLDNGILQEIEKYAIEHPGKTSWDKYIYEKDEYLTEADVEMLEKAGFTVQCREQEGDYRESTTDCQYIYISW